LETESAALGRAVSAGFYRSFKMRYLLYTLPVMFLVSGLLTILLAGFAVRSLEEQHKQHTGASLAGFSEEMRMIILSRNLSDIQELLRRISIAVDAAELKILNSESEVVAAFDAAKINEIEYTREFTHRLLIQSPAGRPEEWSIVVRIKPGAMHLLIDNFLLYQVLIISVMILASVISAFMAFEKCVNLPLHKLRSRLQNALLERFEQSSEDSESEEFSDIEGDVEILFKKFQEKGRKWWQRTEQAEIAFFDLYLQDESFRFFGNVFSILRTARGNLTSFSDLLMLVSHESRTDAKLAWFDLKETIGSSDSGSHEMVLKIPVSSSQLTSTADENWIIICFFWNSSDKGKLLSGYIKNITAERQREQELRYAEEKFRATYEKLPVGIWRSQSDRFVSMNQEMASLLGYETPQEAVEKIRTISHDVYVSPVDRTFFFDELKKRGQVKNLEMKFRRANGEIFWGSLFGRIFVERGQQYVEGGFVDITARKQSEDLIRQSEESLRHSLEMSGLVAWHFEPATDLFVLRGQVGLLFGVSAENLKSVKAFKKLIFSEDLQNFDEAFERVRRLEPRNQKDPFRVNFRICRINSAQKTEVRWIEAVWGISESSDATRGVVFKGFFVDVTHIRTAHEKLQDAVSRARHEQSDKLQFFTGMSHDIRTPLNAIIGFSELLGPAMQQGKGEQYVEAIQSASRSLIGVIDSILDLSRLESGKVELLPEPCCLNDLALDLEQNFKDEIIKKQLELSVSVDPAVPASLMLDETRLRQILINLLSNAVKFTSNGNVTLRILASPSIKPGIANIVIAVEDSGIGIPESDLAEIFEPFSSRRGRGDRLGSAGLSLAICERLVKLMNGKIKVNSDIERGTRFEISLKDIQIAESGLRARPSVSRQLRKITFAGQKVLVADDTASNRELLSEALQNIGLRVICATDGNEAVAMARQELPDLIFMDIRMPEKDGVCAARELKCHSSTAAIPVVAVTASVSLNEEEQIKGLFSGFLNKPVSLVRLFAEAAKFLRHSSDISDRNETDSVFLPPEAFEQLSDPWRLCETINKEIFPLLEDLDGVVVVVKIRELAEIIKQTAIRHSFNSLTIEATRLSEKAESFDISGMRDSCKRIKKILLQLLKVYSRQTQKAVGQ